MTNEPMTPAVLILLANCRRTHGKYVRARSTYAANPNSPTVSVLRGGMLRIGHWTLVIGHSDYLTPSIKHAKSRVATGSVRNGRTMSKVVAMILPLPTGRRTA